MTFRSLLAVALLAACTTSQPPAPARPATATVAETPECASAAPPADRAELARWEELGRKRHELSGLTVHTLSTVTDCAQLSSRLGGEFATHAETLRQIADLVDRSGGRFARWSDVRFPDESADLGVQALERFRSCELGDGVTRTVNMLLITLTCTVVGRIGGGGIRIGTTPAT